MTTFALDRDAGQPLCAQIIQRLRGDITAGVLPRGTRLPSTRQLARDLRVSRITVTNAYAELEADGLIETRAGSGTFVRPLRALHGEVDVGADVEELPAWQQALALPRKPVRERMLREAMRDPSDDGVVAFACARGDTRLFPLDELRRTVAGVVRDDGVAALGYDDTAGYAPLRSLLAQYLRRQGVDARQDDVIVTAGAQQAIDLVVRLFVRPGDVVLVESPTYPAALEALELRGASIRGIPLDADGLRTDVLERALAEVRPSMLYTVPTFHNPTGTVMSASRRSRVVALAHEHGVPVVEDDYMREVRFGSPIPPPIAAFDRHGDVLHVGSFSKSLIPALRLGYLVARGPARDRLLALKRVSDLCCSTLLQRSLHAFLERGALQRHWKRASRVYRRRHAAMLSALRRHFPPEARWAAADGGLGLWVELPPDVSVAALFDEAIRHRVSFAEGAAFFPEPADQPYMRLGFASLGEEQIERGIAILGELLGRGDARRSPAWRVGGRLPHPPPPASAAAPAVAVPGG